MNSEERDKAIRNILSKEFDAKVTKQELEYAKGKMHEFDIVAHTENGLVVGEIKKNEYGNINRYYSKKCRIAFDCLLLASIEASRKLMVFTNREFYEHIKEDLECLISNDIEIRLVEIEQKS